MPSPYVPLWYLAQRTRYRPRAIQLGGIFRVTTILGNEKSDLGWPVLVTFRYSGIPRRVSGTTGYVSAAWYTYYMDGNLGVL